MAIRGFFCFPFLLFPSPSGVRLRLLIFARCGAYACDSREIVSPQVAKANRDWRCCRHQVSFGLGIAAEEIYHKEVENICKGDWAGSE